MDNSDAGLFLVLTVCFILANGFFSLMETALTESRKGTLEKLAEDGSPSAKSALALLERPEETLSVMQLGITFMGILSGLSSSLLLSPFLASQLMFLPHPKATALVISTIIITYFLLLLGEFLPKKIAFQKPEYMLLKYHKLLTTLTLFTRPLVGLLSKSANIILLIFGINPHVEDTVTEEEVKELIEQGTEDGTFEKTEQGMVDRIFRLSDQTAYALMTPRTQMLWLDLEDSLKHNLKIIREHPQSVFPVGRDNLDDFCGVLHAKDLLDASLERKSLELSQYLRKPLSIPRSMETFRLLEKFCDTGTHEAMVLDEYGGVIGFITLDDILQEIIGDMQAAGEPDAIQFIQRDENSWFVDGLCSIDDFKERFHVETLPDENHDHFQTMGGFVTSYFGYIPKEGEHFEWNGMIFEVLDMDRARIDKILITQKNEPQDKTSPQTTE